VKKLFTRTAHLAHRKTGNTFLFRSLLNVLQLTWGSDVNLLIATDWHFGTFLILDIRIANVFAYCAAKAAFSYFESFLFCKELSLSLISSLLSNNIHKI
jgi:hypothetical protein